MRAVADRLTYANVMATLAVVIALGGTAYAAVKINGRDIVNRSIPGSKLKKRAVTAKELQLKGLTVPRAAIADQVNKLSVSGVKIGRGSKRVERRDLTGDAGNSLVKLSAGDTQVLLQRDPFTFRVTCEKSAQDGYQSDITVTSSSGPWYFPENLG